MMSLNVGGDFHHFVDDDDDGGGGDDVADAS